MPRFGDRLRSMIKDRHLTLQEFASRAGVSMDTVARALKMSAPQVNQTTYRKLAEGLSVTPDQFDRLWRGARVPQQIIEDAATRSDIPVFDQIPAGNGDFDPTHLGDDNGLAERTIPRWLVGIDDPTAYGAIVRGDSMSPKYQDGDVVICSPQATHSSGMVAAYRLDSGECGVKMIVDLGDDRVELRPANDRHDVRIVTRESITRLARVVGRFERMAGG